MRSSVRETFMDVYSYALAGGCVLLVAASLVVALRKEIAGRSLGTVGLTAAHWQIVNGHLFLPTGGQLICPLV
ncbi:hypothetical protein, partial [Pseudarthrobacter sp. fls2-241-R2A-127]|uniref:hypothetical protein n=1 Tax=Pseudarthrobacter sp. fls2-241-R2A-127 TaxID=3040303 RepID=UPI002556C5FC